MNQKILLPQIVVIFRRVDDESSKIVINVKIWAAELESKAKIFCSKSVTTELRIVLNDY